MIKNELLREAGENIEYTKKQILEFARCRQDIFYFAEKYFKTRNAKTGEVANIKLYPYQKKIINFFVNPPDNKRNIIIIQPRQSGKTTVVSAEMCREKMLEQDQYREWLEPEEEEFSGVINVWHVVRFKPYMGSVGAWLKNCGQSGTTAFSMFILRLNRFRKRKRNRGFKTENFRT